MGIERYTHIGICVTDLERSIAFYRDLLGFVELKRSDMGGPPLDRLNQLEGVKVHTVFLERDGSRVELMEFASPGWVGEREARPMNRLGVTHLAFRVSEFDALCDRLEAAGGALIGATRIDMPGPTRVIMATDPDGVRIELLEAPGPLDAVPGP
jgi:catechol 2,3-dioxygenase-like lactoylglutathione lyase family enzyme